MINGKKTYIIAFVGALLNACVSVGWIPQEFSDAINPLLAFLGLGALRDGIRSSNNSSTNNKGE